MTDSRPSTAVPLRILMAALAFQGLSGVAGGVGLIADPGGTAIGIPLAWLQGSPFTSYLVPGVVLLTVLGIGPLVVAYGLWTSRSWSAVAALAIGAALLVWIAVQIAVVGYQAEPPLQLSYGVLGAVIVITSVRLSLRSRAPGGDMR